MPVTLTKSKWSSGVLEFYRSSALTTGTIEALKISQTLTGTGTGHYVHALQVNTTTNVKVGNIAGIRSYVDFSTNGYVNGAASAFVAEFDMPGSAVVRGTYRAISVEIGCPDNFSAGNNPIVAFHVDAYGNTKTQFDVVGYLFELTGMVSGQNSFWYDAQKAAPAVEEWLRVKTPKGDRWLGLYDANH